MTHVATGDTEGHSETLYFPFIAIFVGLLLDEVNKKFSFVGLPDSVFQFLFALVSSALVCVCLPVDMVEWVNARTWAKLEPDTVLTILLPPLIFESSFKINAHSFFAKKWYIVALTSFVYIWTLILSTGILLSPMMIFHHCDWQAVALFVSIIMATYPVAVVAMLEQYGAPHRLRLLIEGESLLNDGLALTAYRILKQLMVAAQQKTAVEYKGLVTAALMCILLSPPLGMLLAWLTAWFVKKLSNAKAQQGFIIVAVYGTFIFFNLIEGSAALGLVCFGVTLSLLKEDIGPDTSEGVLQLWQALAYACNNIMFIFSGYVVGREIFSRGQGDQLYDLFILCFGRLIYVSQKFLSEKNDRLKPTAEKKTCKPLSEEDSDYEVYEKTVWSDGKELDTEASDCYAVEYPLVKKIPEVKFCTEDAGEFCDESVADRPEKGQISISYTVPETYGEKPTKLMFDDEHKDCESGQMCDTKLDDFKEQEDLDSVGMSARFTCPLTTNLIFGVCQTDGDCQDEKKVGDDVGQPFECSKEEVGYPFNEQEREATTTAPLPPTTEEKSATDVSTTLGADDGESSSVVTEKSTTEAVEEGEYCEESEWEAEEIEWQMRIDQLIPLLLFLFVSIEGKTVTILSNKSLNVAAPRGYRYDKTGPLPKGLHCLRFFTESGLNKSTMLYVSAAGIDETRILPMAGCHKVENNQYFNPQNLTYTEKEKIRAIIKTAGGNVPEDEMVRTKNLHIDHNS